MIKSVKLAKEIVVTVVNKIGVLADISKFIAVYGINIDAVAGYSANNEAKIMLVTEDNIRAMDTLKKSGYNSVKENEVVMVDLENKAGALQDITAKLANAGIDIKQIYGSACTAGCPAKIIIASEDIQKTLAALKK